jgi:hypothetical protein
MSSAELIAADDHLASCDACYRSIRDSENPADMFASLSTDAPTAATSASDHLSYERLASYIDGNQDDVEREICDVHLQICKRCTDELRDLDAFKTAMSDSVSANGRASRFSFYDILESFWRRPTQWSRLQFAGAAVVAALVVGVACSIWMMYRSRPAEIAKRAQPPVTSQSPIPEGGSFERALPPLENLTLDDGGGQVKLDREGKLGGLSDLSPSNQQAVKTAFTTGYVNLSPELKQLSTKVGVLMGGKAEGVTFGLLSPVGTLVRTARPTFHWQSLDGASGYVVNIYDSNFNKVATSQQLSATQWMITSSLRRGTVYMWQITAIKNGVEIKSPVQPAPEAKFKILERSKANELERVMRAHPNSHLILGTLYAQDGLLDDAEREFRALVAANPKSLVAQALLRKVRR